MNEIPEVIEQLYYNWVVIPDPDKWAEGIGQTPELARGLYSFYQGICLGMGLAEARENWEPLPVQKFLR